HQCEVRAVDRFAVESEDVLLKARLPDVDDAVHGAAHGTMIVEKIGEVCVVEWTVSGFFGGESEFHKAELTADGHAMVGVLPLDAIANSNVRVKVDGLHGMPSGGEDLRCLANLTDVVHSLHSSSVKSHAGRIEQAWRRRHPAAVVAQHRCSSKSLHDEGPHNGCVTRP